MTNLEVPVYIDLSLDEKINSYLYFGYVPDQLPSLLIDTFFEQPSLYTPATAGSVLDMVMDDIAKDVPPDSNIIVPISGGWDSRVLLGAVMQRFSRRRIRTYTFGAPGQLDFDIGRLVAESMGLSHHAINLNEVSLSWEALVDSVKESPWTYVPDGFFNRYALRLVASSNDIVFVGFLGEALTGGHFSDLTSFESVKKYIINKEQRVKSVSLFNEKPKVHTSKIDWEGNSRKYSEILDLAIRQSNCIAPIVTPQKRWGFWSEEMGLDPVSGARIIAPFVNPRWAKFWGEVPNDLKKRQHLYLEMLRYKYPDLAALPSKYSFGYNHPAISFSSRLFSKAQRTLNTIFPKWIPSANAGFNYVDYSSHFREREDYKFVLSTAIEFLKDNRIASWINYDVLVDQHMSYKFDNKEAFLVLIGLAANLEVELGKKDFVS